MEEKKSAVRGHLHLSIFCMISEAKGLLSFLSRLVSPGKISQARACYEPKPTLENRIP
jgi:hypothetical protein